MTTNDPIQGNIEHNSWLTCRIATDFDRIAHEAEVIFYASTFEEALSNATGFNHNFTFLDTADIPTI